MFLFFLAGLEVVEQRVPRRALGLGTAGWAMSLAIGLTAGTILEMSGVDAEGWVLGIALATTSLGALVLILSDAGSQDAARNRYLGNGVAGEFWPIVVISVFLTGVRSPPRRSSSSASAPSSRLPGWQRLAHARPPSFACCRRRCTRPRCRRRSGSRSSSSPPSSSSPRKWASTSSWARSRRARRGARPRQARRRGRAHAPEGIGFGFLIPIYFATTGLDFDVDSLLTASGSALAAPFLALLLFVIRGSASLPWRRELGPRRTLSLALFVATGLPLIVAIVDIGTDRGAMDSDVGASLIGAGMISVLVFPFATRLTGKREPGEPLTCRVEEPAVEL